MPNTGRLYTPAAAASFRERYMRPYSVSSSVAPSSARGATPQQPSRIGFRRAEEESTGGLATAFDSRIRSRPQVTFDRSIADDRGYTVTYADKGQRYWGARDEPARYESHQPSMSFKNLPDTTYSVRAEAPTNQRGIDVQDSFGKPSTLPRLAAILSRQTGVENSGQSARKRPRDFSPSREDSPYVTKQTRLYESNVVVEGRRRVAAAEAENHSRSTDPLTTFANLSSTLKPLPSLHASFTSDNHARSLGEDHNVYSSSSYGVGTVHQSFRGDAVAKSRSPVFELHHMHRPGILTPTAKESAFANSFARGFSSPSDRTSEGEDEVCVIEAAADLVEERSPSKRESITKLLLKSKEFLKAKSLVRNRNNEIDWVATFLNVGFDSNSIYSLMCPLRKGRWKVEEEKYTMELLRLIENGTIRLRHGQSIRGFIAKKLHSDDMRVLKKLSNCKMFHFARLINPRMSDEQEVDETIPDVRSSLDRLDKLKSEFLRSVQLEALVAVRKYLSDTSIRDLLNSRG